MLSSTIIIIKQSFIIIILTVYQIANQEFCSYYIYIKINKNIPAPWQNSITRKDSAYFPSQRVSTLQKGSEADADLILETRTYPESLQNKQ